MCLRWIARAAQTRHTIRNDVVSMLESKTAVTILATNLSVKPRSHFWRTSICLAVCAYLGLGAATNSIRFYHWFLLVAIPFALWSGDRARRFFIDWAPLFAFWLVYDRLRLIQPWLYGRVSVEPAYRIERSVFGWMASGAVPAHAAHTWFSNHTSALARGVDWLAQAVYFSHLLFVPLFILALWLVGEHRKQYRVLFVRFIRAFTLLNFSAIAIYLLIPVAPPWWVTLNGMAQPTADSVGQLNMSAAMNGLLIQGMISNASQWFAAVPSLHGAYPVLMFLLFSKRGTRAGRTGLVIYGVAMWTATVVLNQHYIVDLIAGAVLAFVVWWIESLFKRPDG